MSFLEESLGFGDFGAREGADASEGALWVQVLNT